ncbi:MAG: NAD(P)H-dependent oxidoreductase [Pirellulales bacterium]|nr:NAD(P)H-dependent oxidoreductase [Pirellulales bacterium]
MKVLVVIGHQNQGSYCHALAAAAVEEASSAGHEVIFHDLYAENFDPILTHGEITGETESDPVATRHCEELLSADVIVVVHPNWWGQPPAILKGWVDRVFQNGKVYEFGEKGQVIGHLAGKAVRVLTTSNTPRDVELAVYGDPLQNLWETCIFQLCGVENFKRRNFESIIMSTQEEREKWLAEVRETVKEVC